MAKKSNRGGRRPGAGRPAKDQAGCRTVSISLPAGLLTRLDRAGRRLRITRSAILQRAAVIIVERLEQTTEE